MKIKTMKLKDLKAARYNPRDITDEAMKGLRASIRRFGLVDLIIMNEKTGNVISGHQRILAAIEEGIETAKVVIVDMPESEERALNVTLNNPRIQGSFTDELQDLLSGIMDDIGEDDFKELRLDAILSGISVAEEEWENMPDYESEDVGPVRQLIVSFKDDKDVESFAKLVKQKITPKTKSIWFPEVKPEQLKNKHYED